MLSILGVPGWFETMLNLSLQATLLAGVVWLVLKAFGRWIPPSWRALMWFLVIARVLIPYALPTQFSLQNFFKTPPRAVAPIVQRPQAPESQLSVPTARPLQTAIETRAGAVTPKSVTPAPRRAVSPGGILTTAWRIVALFLLALLGMRALMIRYRLVRHGAPATSFILQLLADCRAELGLRYPIRVTVSDRIAAPALTGIIPARLIIPTTFETPRFTATQMRQILLHELAHVQQGHLILHWLTLIARAIHWFNPAIHFAANRLRQECEIAADSAALKKSTSEERASYGETILQVIANSKVAPTLLALGMAEQARHLQQRLRALTTSQRRFAPLGVACALFVGLAGLAGAAPPANDKDAAPRTNFAGERGVAAAAADNLEKPNLSANTTALDTNNPAITPARKRLLQKLETIRIDDLPVTANTPLIEILKELGSEVRKRDATGRGVNFIISQAADRGSNGPAVDVEQFQIRFDPPIRDVTLGQFFEALVHVAKPPPDGPETARLKFTVEDYAVIFSQEVKDQSATVPPRKSAASSDTSGSLGAAPAERPLSGARQKVLQKLDSIGMDDFPLSSPVDLIEVLKELAMETRKRDPEHRGVNFVIDKAKGRAVNSTIDLDQFKIKIDPPVRNVTLHELCEVMIRVAEPPEGAPQTATLTYSIEDYGVVFSLSGIGDALPAAGGKVQAAVEPPGATEK